MYRYTLADPVTPDPTPLLGDFGLALHVTDDGQPNPGSYPYGGTEDNEAPEQLQTNMQAHDGTPLSAKTNVWGIGNIIGSMLWSSDHQQGRGYYEGWGGLYSDGGPQEPSFDETEEGVFSQDLRNLIKRCMDYKPENRPTSLELLRLVRMYADEHTSDVRRAAENDPVWTWNHYTLPAGALTNAWGHANVSGLRPLPNGGVFPVPPALEDTLVFDPDKVGLLEVPDVAD